MTGSGEQELPADLKAHFESGLSFDLSLELGPAGDRERGNKAIEHLWTCTGVSGPWAGSIVPNGPECEFGILEMFDVASLPFIVQCIQESCASDHDLAQPIKFGIQTREPSDWLTLGFPVRALRSWWSVDGSWRVVTQPWVLALCSALAGIVDHLYARAPFCVGVMGEEASGCWRRPTPTRREEAHHGYPPLALLSAEVIEKRGGFFVSPEIWAQLAPATVPAVLSSGLLYVPPHPDAALLGA